MVKYIYFSQLVLYLISKHNK